MLTNHSNLTKTVLHSLSDDTRRHATNNTLLHRRSNPHCHPGMCNVIVTLYSINRHSHRDVSIPLGAA